MSEGSIASSQWTKSAGYCSAKYLQWDLLKPEKARLVRQKCY